MNNQRKTKESNLDKEYREMLFQYSFGDIKESNNTRVPKYEFACPFCSDQRKSYKKKAKCSAMFWVETRGCFKFHCFNHGSTKCSSVVEFPKFLENYNPELFREYQIKRFHEGTTGGRWNCPHPPGIVASLSTPTKNLPSRSAG
jgi:hypothetical protein